MAKRSRWFISALLASLLTAIGCGSRAAPQRGTTTQNSSNSSNVTVAPTGLNFSEVALGNQSAPQHVQLANPAGGIAVAVTVTSNSPEFAPVNNCGMSVPAGASCAIGITFTPAQAGLRTGTLTLTIAPGNTSTTVTVSGTGADGCCQHSFGPGIPVQTNAWTTFQTNGFPAEIVGYDGLTFAPDNALGVGQSARFLTLGKYFQYSSEPNYCITGWSYKENRWDILDCNPEYHTTHGMEAGHTNGAWGVTPSSPYSPYSNYLFYWGGQSGSNMPEIAHHTWGWDLAGRTGRDWTGWGGNGNGLQPGNTQVMSAAYDSVNMRMVFFPDANGNVETEDLGSLVKVAPNVNGTPPPAGLLFQAATFDSTDGLVWMMGGWLGNSACTTGTMVNLSTVWTYNAASSTWTAVNVAPDPVHGTPGARGYMALAYDPDDNGAGNSGGVFLLVGGEYNNGGTCAAYNDVWELINPDTAPTWHLVRAATPNARWNPISRGTYGGAQYASSTNFLAAATDYPFWKLAYYPGTHAFVMMLSSNPVDDATLGFSPYVAGIHGNYKARVWVYCMDGQICPNIQTESTNYADADPSADNRQEHGLSSIPWTAQSWASMPALASSGTALYSTWIETQGGVFAPSSCGPGWHHPTSQYTTDGVTWHYMGNACSGMDSNASTTPRDANFPSIAVVAGTPWACWSVSKGAEVHSDTLYCGNWNGNSWLSRAVAGAGNPLGGSTNAFAGWNAIAPVGGQPAVALIQINKSLTAYPAEVYLTQYNGTSWAQTGSKLNVVSADATTCTSCTYAESVALATDGTRPYVAWTEYQQAVSASATDTAGMGYIPNGGQALIARWNGSGWVNPATGNAWQPFCTAAISTSCDNSLNVSKNNWATGISATYVGNQLYVAWTEHSLGGNAQVYVKRFDGTSWTLLTGGSLNRDTTNGYAFQTALANDGTNVYVCWDEQNKGSVDKIYCDMWNGSVISTLGPAVNIDDVNGTAKYPTVAVLNGKPVVAWQEIQIGQAMQVYSKQWNGSTWTSRFGQ